MIMTAVGFAIIAIVIALMLFNSGEDVPTVEAVRLDLDPVMGILNAPVTIIEYGAYGVSCVRGVARGGRD